MENVDFTYLCKMKELWFRTIAEKSNGMPSSENVSLATPVKLKLSSGLFC